MQPSRNRPQPSRGNFLALAVVLLVPGLAAAASPEAQPEARAEGWLRPFDLSGSVALESRAFLDSAAHPGQDDGNGSSLVFDAEIHRDWAEGRQSLTLRPFVRLDAVDSERTHWDLRELAWRRSWRRWELVTGVSRVFWGVTESQHLVDIVNQTDLVENPDGEDKLGQAMVKLSTIRSWGILEAFLLPGFRERTFPGVKGRLRPLVAVNQDQPLYESRAGSGHLDWAVRWSHALGPFDVGLSHFQGTSREPLLLPAVTRGDEPSLVPYYPLIRQDGLDLQATLGSWLWKLEAVHRAGFESPRGQPVESGEDSFFATTVGFEYTFWGVLGSSLDLGAVAEHLWDERDGAATTPFDDDLFVGARLAFNDPQSTTILAGVVVDPTSSSRLFLLEASRRLRSRWGLELELRAFSSRRSGGPLSSLRFDHHLRLSIQRHL